MNRHSSILQRALGSEFQTLHPRIQQQYEIDSNTGKAWVGRGIMTEIYRGPWFMVPFLRLGSARRILFTETGKNIPFTVENYAYRDSINRETLTWKRAFQFPERERHFDETLIFSEKRSRPIVFAGTHQHLSVDLEFSAENGDLVLKTGAQRLFLPMLTLHFPQLLSGVAHVRETYNEQQERFEIDVDIRNSIFGTIFGYRGWFHLEMIECNRDAIPADAFPVIESARE